MTKKIETIFTHGKTDGVPNELGIDNAGRLYWKKKAVVSMQKIELQIWVYVAIIIGAVSTLGIAVFSALSYFKSI